MVKSVVDTACAVLLAAGLVSCGSTQAASSHPRTTSSDSELSQIEAADNVGTPLANVHVMVEARPISKKAWGARPSPLLGEGATDGEGHIQVPLAPPDLADPIIVQDQFYNIQVSLVVEQHRPVLHIVSSQCSGGIDCAYRGNGRPMEARREY